MTDNKSLGKEDTLILRKLGLVVVALVVIMLACIGIALSI